MYMQSQGSLREPQTVLSLRGGRYCIIRCGFKDAKWVCEWTRRRIRRKSLCFFGGGFLDPNVPILDRRPNLDMNLSEWNNFFLEICFDVWFCKEHMEMRR